MRHMRYSRLLIVLLMSALLVSGPAASAFAAPQPNPSASPATYQGDEFWNTLIVGSGLDVTSMDPHVLTALAGAVITRNVYETLVRYEGDQLEIGPLLATSWEISPDGKAYTFQLREGVTFHDGTPFNADAVKFSFDRLFALNKGPVNNFAMIDTIEVVDDFTVRFTLKYAFEPFLQILGGLFGGQIVSPAAVQANEVDGDMAEAWLTQNAVGTGPYELESVTPGEQTILIQNETYWGGWDGNHVRRVVLRDVREAATQRQLIVQGEIDIAENILQEDIPALQENPDINVEVFPSFRSFYIYFHTQRGPLADKRVRQAISYAIDYDAIINQAMLGFASRLTGPIPEGMWGQDPSIAHPGRDLEKAKQLLAEAGYPNGGFELEYMYIGLDYQRIIGEILQSNLAELGIDVRLESVTVAAGRARRETPETSPDMFIYYSVPKYADPDDMAYNLFSSKSFPPRGANWGWYKNPRVDEILEEARFSTDDEQRLELYKEFQQLVQDDAPAIFLMMTPEIFVTRSWVKGLEYNMMYSRALYFYTAYKEPPQ